MNKKKSVLCVLLSLIFNMASFVYADAAINVNNWEVVYEGEGADNINRKDNCITVNNEYAFSGNRAVTVKYKTAVENGYISYVNDSVDLPEGDYTLSFYIRGAFSKKYTTVGLGSTQTLLNDSSWIVSDKVGSDGMTWKRYEITVAYSGGEGEVKFIFGGGTQECLIDNVSLCNGAGDEFVKNGGFEALSENIVSEYNPLEYDITRFIATPFDGGVAVSWRNPVTPLLTSATLYRVENERDIKLTDELSVMPEQVVAYKDSGLKNGVVYKYKLKMVYADGTENEFFTFAAPTASYSLANGWGLDISKANSQGFTPIDVRLTDEDSYDGDVSVQIVSNIKSGSNIFANIMKSVSGLEVGCDYRLSFYAKAENNNIAIQVQNNWKNLPGVSSAVIPGMAGTYEWKRFNVDIKEMTSSGLSLMFILNNSCDSLLLDNFELRKVENGEITGDNLIGNGSFETGYEDGCENQLLKFSAEGGDEQGVIYYQSENTKEIRLYQLVRGEYSYRGILPPDGKSVTVSGLMADTEYTFALAPVNSFGSKGAMSDVTFSTILPDFKIYTPQISYKSNNADCIIDGGTYNVSTKVRNNSIENPVSVTQLISVWRGDEMISLTSESIFAEKLESGEISDYLTGTAFIPEKNPEEYHIEIYLWDSKAGMMSFYDYVNFK